ncbi:Gfo/Idh/MocA family oxidoreductase [Paenibacillus sp. FSL W8-0186]|uniref:Dehydrogenase n=1 Tax=Paenibacillus woosongensis TaxID=307580 RepID=A0A7X3CMR1_9BACL|nr:Gfo/Idh/MocA family oxidoreductase [Paenibacillus woosongensis]MUG44412.1 gfo/Idh/MocA family oxidoreductase [Paenibacillus woosongensis]GIP59831.1 dehydrogenase [Paenibacillus woosongensis]
MGNKIKAGIVGTGFIGPAHIEAIRRLGFVEVIALADSDMENARKKADELHIPLAYGNYQDMLNNDDIQVIHNCTPNHLHFEINKAAIVAGKHILSEKPLAVSSEESGELLKLAKQHQVVHGVNFNYRQYPMMKQLNQMIKEDELGDLYLVHGSYLQDWMLYDTDFNWRLLGNLGGQSRALADIGSHWCDTVQYVTGKKIAKVFADLWTVHPVRKRVKGSSLTFAKQQQAEEYDEIPVSTEDYASVLIRFEDGSRGVFTVSQVSAGRKNALSFEINGSKKSVYWQQENPAQMWIGYRDQPNESLIADPALFLQEARGSIHHPGGHGEGWPDAMKNGMLHFYRFIYEGKSLSLDKPEFATFEDGHRSMCVTEAILKSYQTQQWVDVN